MSANREALMCYIRRLASLPLVGELSDADLLGRFIDNSDEQAFTALVKRHAAMVFQVCSRVLGNEPVAEDAFQATFLLLARKANVIRPREALPGWLHGVARRMALKARTARARHSQVKPLPELLVDGNADLLAQISAREMLTVIDEEVQRLPEQYRLPVILCCLGGKTLEEAAQQLDWTFGSVKGRLERGRTRLHERLVRRGLTLSAVLAGVEISRDTTSAATLAILVARTIPGALTFGLRQGLAAGVPKSAATLAGQVSLRLALPRLGLITAIMLVTSVVGAGIAFRLLSNDFETPPLDPSPRNLTASESLLKKKPLVFWDQSDVPVDVRGQVVDPQGKPLAGAELYVGYTERRFVRSHMPEKTPESQSRPTSVPRRATTDANGQFQFRLITSELDPRELDDARPAVIAIAAGFGPQWADLEPTSAGNVRLQLVDDLPAGGRVLDVQKNPIAGVQLTLQGLYSSPADELARFLEPVSKKWVPRCWKGPLPGNKSVVITDAEGRWHCAGLGRDRIAAFVVDGPRVSRTFLNVATRSGAITLRHSRYSPLVEQSSDYVAPPALTIRGTVRDNITHNPIAGIQISVRPGSATTRSGLDGRFEILGHAGTGGFNLETQPDFGQGYFAKQACAQVQAGATEANLDLSLIHGIALSGNVQNLDTGKAPKSARVEYYPLAANKHLKGVSCANRLPASTATVRPDGSYSLVVLPGPGFLGVVASPHENYAVADPLTKELVDLRREYPAVKAQVESSSLNAWIPIPLSSSYPVGLSLNKYHALALINPPKTALSHEQDIALQSARTIQGTVFGPDGQLLDGVELTGLSALRDVTEKLEGSSFVVKGLNPDVHRVLVLQHHGKKLGKVVTVRGDTTHPITIHLEPCGTIQGRLVDQGGKPVPSTNIAFSEDDGPGCPKATTDAMGRFQLDLFTGLKHTWVQPQNQAKAVSAIQVSPGEIRNLGDLVLKPRFIPPRIPKP